MIRKRKLVDIDRLPNALDAFYAEAKRYPLLTAEEEVALAKRIEKGDEKAEDALFNSNLRLVAKIAYRLCYSCKLEPVDYIQDGAIGLYRAVRMFDWRRGIKFSTYATYWIFQAVTRSIANNDLLIRLPVHVHKRIRRLNEAASKALGGILTEREIANILEMDLDDIGSFLQVVDLTRNMIPLDATKEGDDLYANEDSVAEKIESDWPRPDRIVESNVLIGPLLQDSGLDARERKIIERRYGLNGYDRMTLEEVAKAFNLTRERIRQIETRAMEKMRKKAGVRT